MYSRILGSVAARRCEQRTYREQFRAQAFSRSDGRAMLQNHVQFVARALDGRDAAEQVGSQFTIEIRVGVL